MAESTSSLAYEAVHWADQEGYRQCGAKGGLKTVFDSNVSCLDCLARMKAAGLQLTDEQKGLPALLDHFGITSHGHPDYYGGKDNPYEVIKVIHAWGLGFDLGNVVKYVARAGKKHSERAVVDLRKARSYINFAIEEELKKGNG